MQALLLHDSPFHNPVLVLNDASKQQKVLDLVQDFYLPLPKLEKIMQIIKEEMTLGLEAHPQRKSAFYMCNTFVTEFPDGSEEGDYLAMDLGGTNLRIILARLKPGSGPEFRTKSYDIGLEYRRGKPENLFNFLALCIEDFINTNTDIRVKPGKAIPLGFTFSFGFDQLALDKAVITEFSLNTDIPEAVGKDPVEYMRAAIKRRSVNVEVMAILNDTTSTQVYGMYMRRDTHIGFIIGSGTNTCYLESCAKIKSFDPLKTFGKDVKNVIINIEIGYLGDNGSIDFAKTEWDQNIDKESLLPHKNGFEKLIGGLFVGDLIRRTLLSLAESNVFVGGHITDQLMTMDSIGGADVTAIESDDSERTVRQLLQRLGYLSTHITNDDIVIVKYVCALVCVRNALLAAANLSAVIQHIDRRLVRIAIDGSFYKYHPKLQTLIADFIKVLAPNTTVELFLADGGSSKGSAFIAAVAAKNKLQK